MPNFTPEARRFLLVLLPLIWSLILVIAWMLRIYSGLALWMIWNLFLGALPLVWSATFRWLLLRKHRIPAAVFFVLWFLFFPNAPYLVTDLIHLNAPHPHVPEWYVLSALLSCAGTGLLLGYLSLIEVHQVIARRYGPRIGWGVALGSLFLSGFGIYLGRFIRWNSWDAFTHPFALLRSVVALFLHPDSFPPPIPVTLVFGGGLIIGYLALHAIQMYQKPV